MNMRLEPCIVGFDFGTTSLSAIVISLDKKKIKKELCYTTHAYLPLDDTRRKEQSLSVLSGLFGRILEEIHALEGIQILSYGFTGQMHGIIGLDSRGDAVTNLVTWQDRSGSLLLPSGNSLLNHVQACSEGALAEGYGIITLYKWIGYEKRTDITGFCTVADYFASRLSRCNPQQLMDATNAHSIGLFDYRRLEWNLDAIGKLGLGQVRFPEITSGPHIIGYAEEGAGGNIPVVCAIGDNQASFRGSVINPSESVLLNAGTGTQLSCLIHKDEVAFMQKYADGFETQIRPYDADSYLLATSFINGGTVYKSLFNFFKEVGTVLLGVDEIDEAALWERMEKAGRQVADQENALQVSPLLDGQRKDLSQRGTITGLSAADFHPHHFVAGFLKGLADYYKTGYFAELEARTRYICGSGNGLKRNALFREIIEKTFGCPLYTVSYNEEAAVGAALNGALALGRLSKEDCSRFLLELSDASVQTDNN